MTYCKQSEYDSEIKDHVKEILLKCSKYHIPCFLTFAVADDGKDTTYVTEILSPASEGCMLHDDQIVRHAMVSAGFEVIPKKEEPSFEEEMEVL